MDSDYFGIGGAVEGISTGFQLFAEARDNFKNCRPIKGSLDLAVGHVAVQAGLASFWTGIAADVLVAMAGGGPRYSGRYMGGQRAYRTNVPRHPKTNVPVPDPKATGPHSRLQRDAMDPNRVYSATEFDAAGQPVKRIDFAGREGDALPHQHPYDPSTKGFGPKEPLD
jgi:hypothetical protein